MALRSRPKQETEDSYPSPSCSIEFLAKLEEAGLTEDLAQMVVGEKDNASAKRVITLLEELAREKRRERSLVKSDVLPKDKEVLQRLLLLTQSGYIQWHKDSFDSMFGATLEAKLNEMEIRIWRGYSDKTTFSFNIADVVLKIKRGHRLRVKEEFRLAQEIWNIGERQIERRKNEKTHSLLKKLGG